MRKLGLIGGMSWVSTRTYYDRINRYIRRHHDPRATAPMVIESLDLSRIRNDNGEYDWEATTRMVGEAAQRLSDAGAEKLIIGANVLHRIYPEVEGMVETPLLHIAECVGDRMAADGIQTAALIGTRSVMTESYFRRRLVARDIDLLPPRMQDVDTLEHIIFDELMVGKASRDAERALRSMFTDFSKEGAQAVIMANTELEQVVDVDANVLPIYDCTAIHAECAAKWMIGT
ncbi:aspartate/glutamate racemase family protein [Aurantiacibacter gangjinensis]|uniref:Aspartate racemase n=1 Tax=Aurantiacibacter gangjinensis TaxID=502682 RepID=A0A0G9MRA1_9SPHN|nr:amino acid racemase [Aurantiacibacter gangjinensis]APE29160.1 Aspartate racemase [Aurantiacibacter gangjinensis]KLE33230.1 aspartate racemase [Aurantiacibacter gangjinensis]